LLRFLTPITNKIGVNKDRKNTKAIKAEESVSLNFVTLENSRINDENNNKLYPKYIILTMTFMIPILVIN